jgi:hypothetical protein
MAGDRGRARQYGSECEGNVVILAAAETSTTWSRMQPKYWHSCGDLNLFKIRSHHHGWWMGILGLAVGDFHAVSDRSQA